MREQLVEMVDGANFPNQDHGERPWNRNSLFNSFFRNRLSCCIDISRKEGVDILKRLLTISDAFIENNSANAMEKLGLGHEELMDMNRRLIVVNAPSWGRSGPYKDYVGYGDIAEALAGTIQQAGGCMTPDDLAAHTSTWETPVSTTYGPFRLWECPPNGQGITALMALNILEGFDLPRDPLSPDRLHLQIEALRLAFADTRWYVTDPSVSTVPVPELLSKQYAAARRKRIDPKRANPNQDRGAPTAASDTVYLSVIDKSGHACSFINSNYLGFGTGIVPSGWGFTLQNRGHNFSLDPAHPNALAPGKRPYHTIIPGMITRDRPSALFASFGVMGGFMQPQGHVQVFLALADGLDPQAALDLPRFCITDGTAGGAVALEEGIPERAFADLLERGHEVFLVRGYERALFGRGQVILRDAHTGVLSGGSDLRGDGCAMALI